MLFLFGISSGHALQVGEGADEVPAGIPEYANVQAYLNDASRSDHRFVDIDDAIYETFRLEEFHQATEGGLTDDNILADFTDFDAYTTAADAGTVTQLYVEIGDEIYLASVLNSLHTAGTLFEDTLPPSLQTRFATTAVGDSARAKAFDATAVGRSAFAGARDSTAVGQYAGAFGVRGAAIGANTRSYSERAIVVGGNSHAHGRRSTVLGADAAAVGAQTTVAGSFAVAIGTRSSAFGHHARVARLDPGQSLEEAIPEPGGYGGLVECAHEPDYADDRAGFVADCDPYLTAGERADARLSADTEAGATFRAGIRTRLAGRLSALNVQRATAIGDSAQATRDYATALGAGALASGETSTALGTNSVASARDSAALGLSAWATAEGGVAVGADAQAHGANGAAFGAGAVAGGLQAGRRYADAAAYFADTGRTSHTHVLIAGLVYATSALEALPKYADAAAYLADTERAGGVTHVVIAGRLYAVADLDAVTSLTDANLPAVVNAPPGALSGAANTVAVGAGSRASGIHSTAIGTAARAGERSTAVGQRAIATGTRSSAFGRNTQADDRSTATGHFAFALGTRSSAFGHDAHALGERNVALGASSRAGALGNIYYNYDSVAAYLADSGRAADIRDNSPDSNLVVIAGQVYEIAALDAVSGLDESNLPPPVTTASRATAAGYNARAAGDHSAAFGANAQATATYSIALGAQAQATATYSIALGAQAGAGGENGIAIGRGARATGAGGIAIGAGVSAGANQVVIGGASHTYTLPGLAASQSAQTEVVTVGENGQLAADGGALHRRVGDLETTVGAAANPASATGTVFARIGAAQAAADAAQTDADTAQAEVDTLETSVGAAADAASETGSVFARAKAAQADADTAQGEVDALERLVGTDADAASATGSLFARVKAAQAAGGGSTQTDGALGGRVDTLESEVDALETAVGAATDAASETGSVFARVNAAQAAADAAQTDADTAQAEVDALEVTVGTAADTASETGSVFARIGAAQAAADAAQTDADTAQGEVDALEVTVGAATDTASATGSVFARVNAAQAAADAAQTDADTAQGEVDALETTVGTASDAASAAGSVFARVKNAQAEVDALETTVGVATDAASATGSVFARVKNAQADATAAQTAVGARTDTASATGSAHARINELRAAWLAAADNPATAAAMAISTANEAADASRESTAAEVLAIENQVTTSLVTNPGEVVADTSEVIAGNERFDTVRIRLGSQNARVVLRLKGGTTEQIATLLALLRQPAATNQRVVDEQGNPVGTTGAEFAAMDTMRLVDESGTRETDEAYALRQSTSKYDIRTGYLFESLYGNPRDGINHANTDSYNPNENSLFGRHQRGVLRSEQDVEMIDGRGLGAALTQQQRENLRATTAGYRDAPDIGDGDAAPESAAQRRVVVQDVNQDGTIQLRTVESTQLTGTDQRVDALSARVDQTAASSAALSALPNTVPGNRRFFLGLGAGNYRSESAIAIGMSARMRLQSGKADFFANAGAASALSDDSSTSSRIGIGWAW